jgi:hypothetical protein
MVDAHDYSFFGQSTGLIVRSRRVTDSFIFLTCVRKKQDGNWEKISQKEGKTIKISLEEMISFLAVFNKKFPSWKGFHRFRGEDTSIELISRENLKSPFLLKVGPYIKPFTFAQAEIFRMLLEHMIKEKIEHLNGFIKTVQNEEEDDQVNRKVYIKEEMKSNMET